MNIEKLKQLEDNLWDAANALRAYGGIKASDYAVPVLGLIFLRFAENKYARFEQEILAQFEQDKGTRLERTMASIATELCGFYLPAQARYNYLLNLPGDIKSAQALKEAMESIEQDQNPDFQGVLPKDAYFDIEQKKEDILPQLLKTFSDIPDDASGDVFGKIYEYFLGKFALSEGQKGGEFFTPTSVVRFIVEVIEPFKGKLFDPACGSGGMFVQSANFLEKAARDRSALYVEGQEFMGETVRLAKMNLMVNNLRGEIKQVNSYESDPFSSMGKYDYVMANPPFNVKGIQESTVKTDARFTTYGLPKPKGKKKQDKITDANYLWISLFATALNDSGRAGFVMANSASDARNAEGEIRRKIVDTGMVDCMVTIPSNMFYTVTLPATLWFFDKGKQQTDRRDKILFIDARNTFRQLDRAHRDWTEEQIRNLSAIVRLYRGETHRYHALITRYISQAVDAVSEIAEPVDAYRKAFNQMLANLKQYARESEAKRKKPGKEKLQESGLPERLTRLQEKAAIPLPDTAALLQFVEKAKQVGPAQVNVCQLAFTDCLKDFVSRYKAVIDNLNQAHNELLAIYKSATRVLRIKQDKRWSELALIGADKLLQAYFLRVVFDDPVKDVRGVLNWPIYWYEALHWLQSRFPDGEYTDVTGLCKAANREAYAEEQDYSLNPGRYVGVVIDGEDISQEEFETSVKAKTQKLQELTEASNLLEKQILVTVSNLFED